ncbi:MAG: sulfur globule protein precursor [Hyphomicrobiales bacterium]|nr:sulfur globule protein precursor [Hyphomicrobiales bacterium]
MTRTKKTIAAAIAAITLAGALAPAPASAHPHFGPWGWGAVGLVGGLARGSMIAGRQPVYEGGCYYQGVYDQWGNYVGRRMICQ